MSEQETPHGPDWSDWGIDHPEEGPSCRCGFNGSPEECVAWRESEQETPRTVEDAAREEARTRNAVRIYPTPAVRVRDYVEGAAFGATWQAARMPSVEQVRHVLTSYGVDPFDGSCGVPQHDALVDDLVALWGAL